EAGQGMPINVVAGAALTVDAAHQTVKVDGPSGSPNFGGNIVCGGCTLDASATGTNLNGGNVLLAAYSNPGNGNVDFSATGSTIRTGKEEMSGKAGNLTIIAPGAVTLGAVNMTTTRDR